MDLTKVKSCLIKHCKENGYKKPKFKLISKSTERYRASYSVRVVIKGVLTVEGIDISRRFAEKRAAENALIKLKVINKDEMKSENHSNNDNRIIDTIYEENDDNRVETKNQKIITNSLNMKYIDEDIYQSEILVKNRENVNNVKNTMLSENKSITLLMDFCHKRRIPIPFYDFRFKNDLFYCYCKVELNNDNNHEEFVGLGRSLRLKTAKILAAEEVIQKLQDKEQFDVVMNDNEEEKIQENSKKSLDMYSEIMKKDLKNVIDMNSNISIDNSIGYLQEFCIKNNVGPPVYEEITKSGVDHSPVFTTNCFLNINGNKICGSGSGNKKSNAKRFAAEDVIRKIINQ